ncbi:hypothetical protein GUJ93_ZPchr0003g18247 [Zizania palustris]|uniref:Uncharacterized protein n=1 Tax=Zizania palustris TaxID=103762 RepID=A0A8J5SUI6_ZIZPA|nr:hypothetical protein GUJ93_ZPchr0003g18247 [Zizania palustris]
MDGHDRPNATWDTLESSAYGREELQRVVGLVWPCMARRPAGVRVRGGSAEVVDDSTSRAPPPIHPDFGESSLLR